MILGTLEIEKTAALAPMASVADTAFRKICREQGAAYLVSEMVSAKGICYRNEKSLELLQLIPEEQPCAIQLFGNEPDSMAEAAAIASEYSPAAIDINMGCPVPKVAGNGSGAALMKEPKLAEKIIRGVVSATCLPVTVKIRSGWDNDSVNAVEFAKMAQRAGASAITVHCRTKEQGYAFPVDWRIIGNVKKAVGIPVIGNGGVRNAADAAQMYAQTNCDLVMVGMASLGNPFLFREVKALIKNGMAIPPPSDEEKLNMLLYHAKQICSYKGESVGIREARKHAAWYIKGMKGAAKLRSRCGTLNSLDDLKSWIEEIKGSIS